MTSAASNRATVSTPRALALSCHPIPTLAVTAISAGLSALAGLTPARGALVVAAVFAGQLSIGWSNDAIDSARDVAAARSDKPIARGAVTVRTVGLAAATALVVSIGLSLWLGWLPALASLTVVACGWLYNFGLKATPFSFALYAVAFGTLPAVATLALPDPTWPAPWAMLAGALFGVAAHFANVLPDLDDDIESGVRGLPHRLGRRITAVGCPVLFGLASLTILFGGSESTWSGTWLWLTATALCALTGYATVIALLRPNSKALFLLVIVAALAALVLFAFSGRSVT